MQQNFTAVIKQDAGWWIGWIEEVPGVDCQEQSREALIETLKVTLREALELNRQAYPCAALKLATKTCVKPAFYFGGICTF
ncbi:MAG: DUF1902 domain-containing protein [Nitrospira sp.]|nr:DUF1902 domain-containing protein [Nitrospira sp.]